MSDLLSAQIAAALGNSSMIRKMFEAGNELRKKYGNDKVYDFSLGNPDVPAPAAVKTGSAGQIQVPDLRYPDI